MKPASLLVLRKVATSVTGRCYGHKQHALRNKVRHFPGLATFAYTAYRRVMGFLQGRRYKESERIRVLNCGVRS